MSQGLSPIEDVIEDARQGKLFILVDDQIARMKAIYVLWPNLPT